jgi:hypothetical protein
MYQLTNITYCVTGLGFTGDYETWCVEGIHWQQSIGDVGSNPIRLTLHRFIMTRMDA